jgi:hypothetical protein
LEVLLAQANRFFTLPCFDGLKGLLHAAVLVVEEDQLLRLSPRKEHAMNGSDGVPQGVVLQFKMGWNSGIPSSASF